MTVENSRKVKAYRIDPPKDFAKWARICEHVIRHYTEGWANGFRHKIAYWEIWNEPENEEKPETNQMWTGSWDDYCRLYEVAAKHLKGRFPHLKIGGCGSCGFYAAAPGKWVCPRTVYMVDCYTNFLSHVRRTETPLDFFSFHAYSSPSDAVLQTKWAIDTLRAYGDVWALAACYGRRAKVVIANTSDSAKDLSCDFQGRTVSDMILTDASHTYEKVAPATRLPPQSFAVLTLNDFDPASSEISGPRIAYPPNVVATPQLRGVMLPMRDCIEIFNEYGWDWTYHAFREYEGWSVEHEWPDRRRTKPAVS